MKKKINVIDLDKTLLPYTSLIRFVWFFMSDWQCFLPLLFYSMLRVARVMKKDVYLKKILRIVRKTADYETKVKQFGLSLFYNIRKPLLHFILENTDEFTSNVLCTASPEDYVKYLCEKLSWGYLSSTLDTDSDFFIHLSGENKINALRNAYPQQQYIYHIAMSDNKSDAKLLQLFQTPYHIKNGFFGKKFKYHP